MKRKRMSDNDRDKKLIDGLIEYFVHEAQNEILIIYEKHVKEILQSREQESFGVRNIKRIGDDESTPDCGQLLLFDSGRGISRTSPEIFNRDTEETIIKPKTFTIMLEDWVSNNMPDIYLKTYQ